MSKDQEQNLGRGGRIGTTIAAIGLFITTGCGPTSSELANAKSELYGKGIYRIPYYHIDKLSDHLLRAVGEGTWTFQFDPARDAAVALIGNMCTTEKVLTSETSQGKLVVVADADCFDKIVNQASQSPSTH